MRAEEGREMWLTSTVSVYLSSFKYIFLNKCLFIYLLYNLRIISRVFKYLCTCICTEQLYHSAYICMYVCMYPCIYFMTFQYGADPWSSSC